MSGSTGVVNEEEMRHFPFTEAQKAEFLDQQFTAHYQHYTIHYPACERNIIEINGERAGRLWIDEWRDQIRLADIAIMPQWRGSGVGTRLVREVLARGAAAGKPVTIHVEAYKPALRLCERLGFMRTAMVKRSSIAEVVGHRGGR